MPFIRRAGRPGLLGLAARTAVAAGTAQAVSGRVARNQQRRAEAQYEQQQYEAQQQIQSTARQAAAQQPVPPGTGDDLLAKLQQLATLHSQGTLSDDEFAAAKAKLLA